MGRPKALLPIAGVRFIEHIVSALRQTQVSRIVVVLGHNAGEIREKIEHLGVTILINPDYKLGQLSSLRVAIRAVSGPDVEGILVHLVDHPYVSSRLVDSMIERFRASKKLIVVPKYRGRRGHPVIFASALFRELLEAPLEQGAKAVVRAHAADTLEIDTDEEGTVIDIDTPEEYAKYVR